MTVEGFRRKRIAQADRCLCAIVAFERPDTAADIPDWSAFRENRSLRPPAEEPVACRIFGSIRTEKLSPSYRAGTTLK